MVRMVASHALLISLLPGISLCARLEIPPQGQAVEAVKVSAQGAIVTPSREQDLFLLKFPAGHGKPAATFSFKEIDINDRLGLALDIKNTSRKPVRVYADLNGNIWARGFAVVEPGKTGTLYVFAPRKKLAAADVEKFSGMHGLPGGRMSLWDGIDEPMRASALKVFVIAGEQTASVQIGNIRPFGSSKTPDTSGVYPFIDKYGQYKHNDWPGKVHSDMDLKASLEREDADLAAHPGAPGLTKYGGWADGPKLAATGHFRVEKSNGKWWFVDPAGRLFWSNGVDCLNFSDVTRIQGRESYFEDPAPGGNFLIRNLETKYGADWRAVATERDLRRLKSWGLNTIGAWSDPEFTGKQKVPYTAILSSHLSAQNGPGVKAWEDNLRGVMQRAGQTMNDDPWCIGFFVDNELHVSTDPAWFELYYRTVATLAKEYLPNKLYLGSRLDFHEWPDEPQAKQEIVRHAAKYCDVVGFNLYRFTVEDLVLPVGVDKPVIIGEFHIGALDRGLLHTGLRSVIDQNQRAEAYRLYVTSALENPAIVGAHWFKLYDEPTTGRYDGENYQIGFLDGCDTPYPETVAAVREIGYKLYSIRSKKKQRPQ
ncbi:MAG: hypothetical protein ABSE21_00620 [Bryobacteraceae bacterium]